MENKNIKPILQSFNDAGITLTQDQSNTILSCLAEIQKQQDTINSILHPPKRRKTTMTGKQLSEKWN